MPETYYQTKLFPLQDSALGIVQDMNLGFYLTGGTALSRCYLHHRYSDDLDFFMNANPHFKAECTQIIDRFRDERHWTVSVGTVADTFLRMSLETEAVVLKIDFINDVSFHYGDIETCDIFHRVDNWRNILSNKLCSLGRRDVKDLADILFIADSYPFDWQEVIKEAKQKDTWVDPLEICKTVNEFPAALFDTIRWVNPVDPDHLEARIQRLHDDIFWGRKNEPSVSSQ